MFSNIKNDLLYLLNILESVEKIFLYSKDCTEAEMFYELNDQLNFNASLNLFANIGENIGKISDELKQLNTDIDWKQIKGLRNKVVHDYVNIDTFMVFDIIKNDLSILRESLMKIIRNELENVNFDVKEYEEAKKSFYYRHILFEEIG
ncbi:MAG TPA: hypothetical protein DDW65_22960 [Firmicutes bacterium]|jgi:uncharacterized protein with HEPN domain|nr:hypothetical protein [Bacillota bacterium]